ncbi:allatostatins MIP [Agrilus planipennis]|uniref:Allatostatins MIP n=1 Tax=Agrilus planipennis TaxID=224129 RepID=A0A1W4WXN0_AGRPL|nr:allatostatins MIP [Agrilus planipennis]
MPGGWGKRSSVNDDYILNNLVDGISDDGPIPEYSYFVDNENDDEKRAWNNLHSTGWGKRSARRWGNFKGAWGKREPAWTNLKGIWGKRSGSLQ